MRKDRLHASLTPAENDEGITRLTAFTEAVSDREAGDPAGDQ